jgi:hypothetical protein
LSSGELVMILQNVAKPHPDQPKLPLAINYAKTEEGQKLIKAIVHSVGPTARPSYCRRQRQKTGFNYYESLHGYHERSGVLSPTLLKRAWM